MRVAKRMMSGIAAGALAGVVSAGTVAAQANEDSNGGGDGFDSTEVIVAVVFIVAAIVVIGLGLRFSRRYHERLFDSIDAAVEHGAAGPVSTSSETSMTPRPRSFGEIVVTGPASVEVGQSATYEATGATDPDAVEWSIEGGGATPNTGRGASLTATFATPGSAVVNAHLADLPTTPLEVEVVAAPSSSAGEGVVLPFVIKNWARFVVVIFGVGTIAALMALRVLSAEGGIGVLGVLLGVGGASTSSDAESKPTDT